MRKRRILASLLAAAMVMTSMPLNGFAEEGSPEGSMGVFMEAESDGALTENASADAFAEDAADSSSWDTAKEDLSDSQNLTAEDALLASQDLAAEDALLASQDLIAEDAFLASQDLETADAFVSDDTADTYDQGTDDAFYDPQDQETDDASAQLDADTFDGNPSDLSGEDISDLADGMSLPVFDSVSDADTETNTDANTDINAYPDEEANADTAADLLDLTDSRAFDEKAEEEPDGAYAEAADGELSDEAAFEDALLATDFSSTEDDASELLFLDEDGDNPETAKVNITWEFGIDFLEEWDEAQQKNIKVSAYTETVEIGSEIRDCPLYYIPPEGKTVIDWSLQGINGEPVELYDSDTASFPLKAERDMTLYAVWTDTFQVTFDANGGTFDDHGDGLETYTIPTISGEDLTLSAIALPVNTQERMAFAGWSLERNGDIVLDSVEHPSLRVTEDMTLYAVWEQGWLVTLDAGENGSIVEYHGDETENIQTKTVYVTESCGLQLPSPSGADREDAKYWFDCWQMEGNEDERWNGNDFFYPQSDVTLKAHYYTYYKIYWDAGEGYFDGDPEKKRGCSEVSAGEGIFRDVSDPEIADESKGFLGWSNIEGSTQVVDFYDSDGDFAFRADSSMTFYAVWAEAANITFDANGGYLYDDSSDPASRIRSTVKLAQGVQIDPLSYWSPMIENEFKYFAGWCTSLNEEEGQFWDADHWDETHKLTVEGDLTLYAIWKDYCLIHLDLGEGIFDEPASYYNADTGVWEKSSHVTTEKYRQGERIDDGPLSPISYYHSLGKEISGWSRNPDGTDPVDFTYYDEENGEWRSDGLIADHDQTLYAMWDDPITITCNVNGHGYFYDDSDDEFGNNDMYIYYTEELHSVKRSNVYLYCIPSINDEEAELYHFVEWNTMPDGSGESYEARHYYKFSEDTTLYAIWGEQVQVTWDANGGTFEEYGEGTQTITTQPEPGTDISFYDVKEPVNSQERMAFAGWSLKPGGEIVLDSEDLTSMPVSESITLYAVWKEGWLITVDAGEHGYLEVYQDGEPVQTKTWTFAVAKGCSWFLPYTHIDEDPDENSFYSFDCWREAGNDDETFWEGVCYYPQQDTSFSASYLLNYRMYWDAGEGYMEYPESSTVSGEGIEKPWKDPVIDDETRAFLGWSDVEGGTEPIDFKDNEGNDLLFADGSKTFYAIWAESAVITFNGNGGRVENKDYERVERASFKCAKGAKEDVGYRLAYYDDNEKSIVGWSTSADGQGTQFWNSDNPYLTVEDDLTLYAIWEDNVAVNWDAGEGYFGDTVRYFNRSIGKWVENNKVETIFHEKGDPIPDYYPYLLHNDPDKTFCFWSEDPTGTEPAVFDIYDSEGYWTDHFYHADADRTFYAVWGDRVDVTFHTGDNGYFTEWDEYDNEIHVDTRTVSSYDGGTVYAATPESNGEMQFKEWNTKSDGSGVSYESGCDIPASKDVTDLYAIWEASTGHEHHMVKTNRKEAACTTDGNIEYYTCSVCGKYFSDSNGTKELKETELRIPAKGHTVVNDPAVAATCAQAGKTAGSHCSVCNAVITAQKSVPAAGHISDGGKVTKAATCAAAGTKTYTCTRCKAVIKTEAIPATGKHTLQKVELLKATQNTTGVKEHYKCTVCGGLFEDAKGTKATTAAALILPKLSQEEADLADEGDVSDPTSVAAAVAKVTKLSDTADPAGSSFAKLRVQSTKQTKNSITLKWNKVKGASGYIIYGNLCGSKYKFERIQKIKEGTTKTFTVKKLANGKKLKKGKYYKFSVIAYKTVKGNDKILTTAKTIHVATSGGKVTNPGKVTLMKGEKKAGSKLSLKAKKSVTLKGVVTAKNEKLKLKAHFKKVKVKYESSNKKIATVNAKGKITAKKKGTCYIYAYAQNGVFAKVEVNVQ